VPNLISAFRANQKDCYYLKNNIWKKSISMLEERAFATMVSLPKELGEKSGLFVTGGFGLGSKDGVRNLGIHTV
jgi:hypothetical protein